MLISDTEPSLVIQMRRYGILLSYNPIAISK